MDIFEKKLGKMRIVFLWKEKKKKMTLLGINTIEMTMTFLNRTTGILKPILISASHSLKSINLQSIFHPCLYAAIGVH